MIEVMVVCAIVAILTIVLMLLIHAGFATRHDSAYRAAAAVVWNGALGYRADHHGIFPTTSAGPAQLSPGLATLDGATYVRRWPEDPLADGDLPLSAGTPRPSTTGTPNTVAYWSNGISASIAAYGGRGEVVFERAASTTTPIPTVG